ncbi:TMEM14 family protein [Crocosphaera sp.]|uniref:TMEM14 family protein n=1 Tax=Crocosphaera sp. TaxID=2729996 RepID=UPI0026240BCF|nr:TMEM14 family protein [Crocosphaera sp.]MDJ0581361.1 TMEM14 family protein [Crocosphaera sp.]
MKIIATLIYGILLLVGGIFGYIKAKSKPSLISGFISGLLLLISGVLQWQQISVGLILAQILTLVLAIVFAIRLWKTRKFMPAGLMLMVSVATLVILVSTIS